MTPNPFVFVLTRGRRSLRIDAKILVKLREYKFMKRGLYDAERERASVPFVLTWAGLDSSAQ